VFEDVERTREEHEDENMPHGGNACNPVRHSRVEPACPFSNASAIRKVSAKRGAHLGPGWRRTTPHDAAYAQHDRTFVTLWPRRGGDR